MSYTLPQKTSVPITYPFVSMNHLAMMLTMLKHRFRFPKQVEHFYGCPIRIIPPGMCPDNNHPLAAWHMSHDTVLPITV